MHSIVKGLVLFAACAGLLAAGQEAPAKKAQYLIRITPKRATFLRDMTAEEGRVMAQHFQYLKDLLAKGKVILAGPVPDPNETFGIIIVETDSEKEAREIMENDPSVKGGINRGDLLPFRVALLRCGRE